jgi:O-antigen/teichoic acid export membrane protein
VGNLLYGASQWGMIVIFTKAFAPEIFGMYAIAMSISTPIFSFSALQLRAVMVSEHKHHKPFALYLAARLSTSLVACFILAGICLTGAVSASTVPIVIALGLGQCVVLIKDIFQGYMQRHERMDAVAISLIIQGGLSIIGIAAFTLLFRNITAAIYGMVLAELIVLIAYDIPVVIRLGSKTRMLSALRDSRLVVNAAQMLTLLRVALPLGIVTLLLTLQTNIPRYFLANSAGESAVGFYTAVATFMALEDLLISALGQSTVRRLSIYYGTDMRRYRHLLFRLILFGLASGLLGVAVVGVFGREMIAVFFRAEYIAYYDVLIWLMVARVILNVGSFLGYGMTSARYFSAALWVYVIMTIVLIVTSWMLIPIWYAQGAAWSVIISSGAGLVASATVLRHELFKRKAA